ncbi:hypothetical protein LCGC14_2964980, partial [marine sediment metagenome]
MSPTIKTSRAAIVLMITLSGPSFL